ncbi:hypothetical protein [Neobacillus mesonae]|uniref:hypothetical protein n=1 Tax=Neobacillus mesonae TaxID=1193713 RepID=UPI00203F180E|nr:hypothetical protein [Neobacillus mesonae]MCM3567725.1 hypothetical protein [Neobacillus mesonae]
MQSIPQEYIFSTYVTSNANPNEFFVEFFLDEPGGNLPIKVTRNFDELMDFLDSFA